MGEWLEGDLGRQVALGFGRLRGGSRVVSWIVTASCIQVSSDSQRGMDTGSDKSKTRISRIETRPANPTLARKDEKTSKKVYEVTILGL